MSLSVGLNPAERGLVPTRLIRQGIRRLLRQRLRGLGQAGSQDEFVADLARGPIALHLAGITAGESSSWRAKKSYSASAVGKSGS